MTQTHLEFIFPLCTVYGTTPHKTLDDYVNESFHNFLASTLRKIILRYQLQAPFF